MVRYRKTVWLMIRDAVDKLGEITARDAKDFIRENYPQDKVNESTVNAQIIAASVNHPSAHHYSSSHRFLFYLGNGRFRKYDVTKDGIWEVTSTGAHKTLGEIKTNEATFSQIDSKGLVQIPKEILEKLHLGERDFVAFVTDEQGTIMLRKARLTPI